MGIVKLFSLTPEEFQEEVCKQLNRMGISVYIAEPIHEDGDTLAMRLILNDGHTYEAVVERRGAKTAKLARQIATKLATRCFADYRRKIDKGEKYDDL